MTRKHRYSLAPVPYKAPLTTPLRRWRWRKRWTWDELVEATGCKRRTLLRVGEGYGCTEVTAEAIHAVTGLSVKGLMRGASE